VSDKPNFHSQIWLDEAQADDPFTAQASYCHGFDVFGQLIQKASYSDYILLMFSGEKPSAPHSNLFEVMAIALANLGPRDASNRAAMNAGVGGAPAASCLISSLAIGAGQTGGCRETYVLTQWFERLGTDTKLWKAQLKEPNSQRLREDIWDEFEHAPGFNPHGVSFPKTLYQLLEALDSCGDFPVIKWLIASRGEFEQELNVPMGLTFISAAVFYELGFNADQAEICALLLSLPGAAVHSLEAKNQGWRKFPFFGKSIELTDDPGPIAPLPIVKELP
jgi:citrate synthase